MMVKPTSLLKDIKRKIF